MQGNGKQPPAGYQLFNSQVVAPGTPAPTGPIAMTPDEQVALSQLHPDKDTPAAYGHMKVITPPGQAKTAQPPTPPPVTPAPDPAILELAHNDDLNVATIARQAHKKRGQEPPDEVVVPLR